MGSAQSLDFNNSNRNWTSINHQRSFKDSLALWPERVILHIANTNLEEGETLFFKAYLLTGKQSKRYAKSGVLNLELLDGNGTMLLRQFHKITDGMVQGQIDLPKQIKAGNYSVKAYTRWSQNYGPEFTGWDRVQVGAKSSEEKRFNESSEISIVSEGATLLSDHVNRIIVKVPSNRENNTGGVGRILDDQNRKVTEVSFYSTGLGTAIFKPMNSGAYHLELGDGTLYPIPKAVKEGYLLQVSNLNEESAKIRIMASSGNLDREVTLIGTVGGINYFEKPVNFSDDNILDVELFKKDFPYGIFNLKLVDNLGTLLAYRPIWMDGKKLKIDIYLVDSDKGTNLRTYKIKVTDHTGTPMKSQLAISANRYEPDVQTNLNQNNAEHNNLFTFSEIFGENKISSYRRKSFLKDLLILSSIEDIGTISKKEDMINGMKFSFQKGLEISGYAYDLNNKLLSHTNIQVLATSEYGVWACEAKTDDQGFIQLEDIQIDGMATIITRTHGEDVNSKLVKIIPLDTTDRKKNILMPHAMESAEQVDDKEANITKPFNIDSVEKIIELEEVEVVEKSDQRKKYTPSLYGIKVPPQRVRFQDFEQPKSLVRLLSEFPGVMVSGSETLNPSVRVVSASGPVLWVLDGFPLSQGGGGPKLGAGFGNISQNPLTDIMALTTPSDIERIELLVGADASIYGTRGSGGIFLIYTRSGSELDYTSRKDGKLDFEGYKVPLDFNQYRGRLSRREKGKIDLLYWNPKLETDENGEVIFTFNVPSDCSSIKIETSTVSLDGKIGSSSIIF